jgi:hypothetical protein
MRQFVRWAVTLGAAAICLVSFQNCSNSGSLTLESSSKLGPFAHGATPPANSIAGISQMTGTTCPSGSQAATGSGYLSQVCLGLYTSSSTDLVVDVKLQGASVACPSDYDQVGSFSSQALCARMMPVRNAVEVVTSLYESTSCSAGDVDVGTEGTSTAMCEKFQ